MLRVSHKRDAILYAHDHDALTVQYPEDMEDVVVPRILEQLKYPVQLEYGRELVIPYDCKTGWNKGDYSESNPQGLKDYTGHDERKREKELPILDRKLR